VLAADAGVLGAELLPSEVEAFIGVGVADLLEAGDPGGRALLRKGIEGLFAAYPGPKSDGILGGGCIFVHLKPLKNRT
jgi:hypothetical protein